MRHKLKWHRPGGKVQELLGYRDHIIIITGVNRLSGKLEAPKDYRLHPAV